jgi:hypothetical protein
MSYRQPGLTSLMVVKSHTVARITLSVSALHNFVVTGRNLANANRRQIRHQALWITEGFSQKNIVLQGTR